MGGPNAIGFVAMAVGLLGALALTVGGLLRLVRPLAQVAGRLLTCSAVGGALAVIVGLCVVMVRVGVLHGRDDVGLIGDQRELVCAMHQAGWYPADPITLKSSIEIVGSVLLDRPYKDAPVSNLYYQGLREDLAFEKPIGSNADRRNHVRYWKVLDQGEEKRPVCLGAATEDSGVGVSRYTAAVTHHISPDLDAERVLLTADLEDAGMVDAKYQVTGIGPTIAGHNGGGDLYYTDGEIWVLRLVEACKRRAGPAITIPSPPATALKDQIWHAIANAMGK